MPIMQVQYPEAALDDERKATLAQRLTDVLIKMEGGANTTAGRAFAWVIFNPVGQQDWWVGGQTDDTFVVPPGRFLVHVTVPEGYMNAAYKSEVHADVNAAIVEVMGGTAAGNPGASVLVVIDEVTEGNWGAAGSTISLASIADKVGLPRDGDRFGWVRAYFSAKSRQLASAGYPADIGGLLNEADGERGAVARTIGSFGPPAARDICGRCEREEGASAGYSGRKSRIVVTRIA
jgi:phenylpyruvate tautomerase PptA (4-oxalocrotonate tautomerase family)